MDRKSLLFVFVAVLTAAVFFTGCPNPSSSDDDDGEGTKTGDTTNGGNNYSPGGEGKPGITIIPTGTISAVTLQTVVGEGGNPIVIDGPLSVTGGGYVDLKRTTITINGGALSFAAATTLNATQATIIIGTGGSITATNALFLLPTTEPAWATQAGGTKTFALTKTIAEIKAADDDAGAVFTVAGPLTIASGKTIDGEALTAVVGSNKKIYVTGKLTNEDNDTTFGTTLSKIIPLGEVESTGNIIINQAASIAGDLKTTGTLTTGASGTLAVGGKLTTTGPVTLGAGGNLTVSGPAEIASLISTGTASATFNGPSASITAYTASQTTFAGTAPLTITTFTDASSASTVTFNGPTTITNAITVGTGGLTIAGTGAVTLSKAPVTTTSLTLSIKSTTGGVTFAAETSIASNIKATNVTVKSSDGSATAIIQSNANLTLPADTSIEVTNPAAKIVVGTTVANQITITGSVLTGGTGGYTGTDGKLSLGASTKIEVEDGGLIVIAGSGHLELTDGTSEVELQAGGAIDVKTATGKIGESTVAQTKISVTGTNGGKATIVKDASNSIWTITDDATGNTGTIVLGAVSFALTGTSAITDVTGTDPTTSAAGGKLIAGAGTTITFEGST
jgi:hypothetical protein